MNAMNSPDYLTALEAVRDSIVADLDACESMRDRAALYTRLESTLRLIKEARPAEQEGDPVDEIARRRSARRAVAAKSPSRAKRSS